MIVRLKNYVHKLLRSSRTVINRYTDISDYTFFCKNMPQDTTYSYSLTGVKSRGTSGFLVYGPYIEIMEAATYVVELSYLTTNKKGKYPGKFDVNLSKKNKDNTFDFIKAEECFLSFTNTKIKKSRLYFDSNKYIGYKVEFRVFVETGVDLYAFQVDIKKIDNRYYEHSTIADQLKETKNEVIRNRYRRLKIALFLIRATILKTWIVLKNPVLLKKWFRQKKSGIIDKVNARIISLINSIVFKRGDIPEVPIRIDHLPRQLKSKFYKKFEVINPDILCDDRFGIHPLQLPSLCFDYMPRDKNGLYQRVWTQEMVRELKKLADRREDYSCEGYPGSVLQHYAALDEISVKGKRAAVIGSISPWLECILLAYKAKEVLTIEYGNIPYDGTDIKILDRFLSPIPSKESYDIICSFSSIEHNGLGRYGDPIDPNGDMQTMDEIFDMLIPSGIALIGIPVAVNNVLVGNGHRAYSKKYLAKHLFKKFKMIGVFAYPFGTSEVNYTKEKMDWQNQPLFILQKP